MDYYSGAPEPTDFDYNNVRGSSGGGFGSFFKRNSFFILLILAAITAILIVIFILTSDEKTHNYETKDKDSTLSELFVSGGTIEPEFSPDVIKYKVYADSDYVTFTCEANSKKAKVKGCDDSVYVEEDSFKYDIKVTAEDGNVTRYYLTIIKRNGVSK